MTEPLKLQAQKANMNIDIKVEILRGARIELMIPTAERYL